MEIDLRSKKVGDTVFCACDGTTEVVNVGLNHLRTENSTVLYCGKYDEEDIHPSYFYDEFECALYFITVSLSKKG